MANPSNSHKTVFPVWGLLPAVGICLLGAALSVPERDELAESFEKDGNHERVAEMAQEERVQKGAIEADVPRTDRDKLRAWLESNDESVRTSTAICLDTRNMCAASSHRTELAEEILAHPKSIDSSLRDSLMDALATGAIGKGTNKGIAEGAKILDQWCRYSPSWAVAQRAAQAYGWADDMGGAVEMFEFMISQSSDRPGRPENFTATMIDMCLAANRPGRAFELSREAWKNAPAPERGKLLHTTLNLASTANRTMDASALVAEYLSSIPFHTCPLSEAVALAKSKIAFPDATAREQYRELASMMACWQWADNKGDAAFDTFLRLTLLGDEQAWHYCQELREGLQGDGPYALVLSERIARGKDLDAEPVLAEILAEQGETARAVALFRSLLSRTKKSAARLALLEKLSDVLMETGDYAGVVNLLGEVVKMSPPALAARKKIAFALVRLARFEQARIEYAYLSPLLPDDEPLQVSYAGLCESTGHFQDAVVARRRIMSAATHRVLPDDYLELADCHRSLGRMQDHVAALLVGLKQFPGSPRLRFILAEAYAAQDKPAEAMRLLAHESLSNNVAAFELLISEASAAKDPSIALAHFGDRIPDCLKKLPVTQLRLAFLFETANRIDAAETIFQELLANHSIRDSGALHKLAATSLDFGDANRACVFQTAHLQRPAAVHDTKGWHLMGDIYMAQQLPVEAGKAYQTAVEILSSAPHPKEVAASAGIYR